jgi:hypothetical protein
VRPLAGSFSQSRSVYGHITDRTPPRYDFPLGPSV